MKRVCIVCLAVLAAGQYAFANYLFTYTDSLGNKLGFLETAPQISGSQSNFLFASGSISDFVFTGIAPSICAVPNGNTIVAPDSGCIAVQTGPQAIDGALSVFPAGSFGAVGTFSSSLGGIAATVRGSSFRAICLPIRICSAISLLSRSPRPRFPVP
jgi:hypothetical protein